MCNVASSHTWSDVGSGLGSRVTDDSLPLVLAGLSSPSGVGSRDCSVQWQAGLRIWSGAGAILLHEADGECRIVVHQHLHHESSKILQGTVPLGGMPRSRK